VHIEDVEAAASIHQHLGEPRVADDRVDDQWLLARIGDAIRVILAAEGDGVPDQSRKEGGAFSVARTSCRSEDHVWFEDQWMVASLCDE
jgi:hypothetical protein